MFLKKALCLAIALALALCGCGKKKQKELEAALAEIPKIETMEEKKDSGDIFDEFYEEGSSMAETKVAKARDDFVGASTEFIPDGRYVVQVSCVASRRLADKVAEDLQARGWPSYVAEVQNPTPDLMGTYYRIRIGGFNYVTPARQFGEGSLAAAGYEFWVDNRSNDNVGMGGYGLGESNVGEYGGYGSSSAPQPSTSSWSAAPEPAPASTGTSTSTTSDESWGQSQVETPAAEPQPAPSTPAPSVQKQETPPPAPAQEAPAQEQAPAEEQKPSPADGWGGSGEDWGDDSGW